ncbi:aminotransferase class I/II-fold pyridoxal phosphate-dependent enzyme [Bacteroidota bacterium]
MKINEFKLERYFAQHEFTAKYLLSSSGCDGYSVQDILLHASTEEIAVWTNLKLGYTESEGNPLLRQAIGKHYQNASKENIIVASPGELNFIAMNVLLNAGDHVITVLPAYQSLYEVVRSLGCDISYWKPNPGNWHFNPDDLEQLVQKNTKLIIINFPHNPTGSYLTRSELNKVVDIARKNNIPIFSDEMYHKLTISEMEELPPLSDIYERGISLWGTSKSFGMAGLRIGWIVTKDTELIKKILAFKDYLSICNNAPSEILALIALNHINKFVIPNIQKIKRNIQIFKDFATQHGNLFHFIPPKAGSTAFVKLNIKETALEFSNKLVEQTGIMTVPAEMFGFEDKYLRIGFGRESLPETLNELEKYLDLN